MAESYSLATAPPVGYSDPGPILSSIKRMKVSQLKELTRSLNLKRTGLKADLIGTITEFVLRQTADSVLMLTIRCLIFLLFHRPDLPPFTAVYEAIRRGTLNYHSLAESLRSPPATASAQAQLVSQLQASGVISSPHPPSSSANTSPPHGTGSVPNYRNHRSNYALHRQDRQSVQAPISDFCIFFNDSPFYKVSNDLGCSPQVGIGSASRREVVMKFVLNEEERKFLEHPSHRLYVFCGKMGRESVLYDAPLTYPAKMEFHINGQILRDTSVRGIKNEPHSARPLDITSYLNRTGLNDFSMVFIENAKFLVYAKLVTKVEVDELIASSKFERVSSEMELERIRQYYQNDDEISVDSYTMSLKCPLSYRRISIPAKAPDCDHVQCFDLVSFLSLQEQLPTWRCPICSRKVNFNDMVISDYCSEILKGTDEDTENILLNADGTWKALSEEEMDKTQSRRPPSSQPSKPTAANPQVSEEEIIILDSDEEMEDAEDNSTSNNDISMEDSRHIDRSISPPTNGTIMETNHQDSEGSHQQNVLRQAQNVATGPTSHSNASEQAAHDSEPASHIRQRTPTPIPQERTPTPLPQDEGTSTPVHDQRSSTPVQDRRTPTPFPEEGSPQTSSAIFEDASSHLRQLSDQRASYRETTSNNANSVHSRPSEPHSTSQGTNSLQSSSTDHGPEHMNKAAQSSNPIASSGPNESHNTSNNESDSAEVIILDSDDEERSIPPPPPPPPPQRAPENRHSSNISEPSKHVPNNIDPSLPPPPPPLPPPSVPPPPHILHRSVPSDSMPVPFVNYDKHVPNNTEKPNQPILLSNKVQSESITSSGPNTENPKATNSPDSRVNNHIVPTTPNEGNENSNETGSSSKNIENGNNIHNNGSNSVSPPQVRPERSVVPPDGSVPPAAPRALIPATSNNTASAVNHPQRAPVIRSSRSYNLNLHLNSGASPQNRFSPVNTNHATTNHATTTNPAVYVNAPYNIHPHLTKPNPGIVTNNPVNGAFQMPPSSRSHVHPQQRSLFGFNNRVQNVFQPSPQSTHLDRQNLTPRVPNSYTPSASPPQQNMVPANYSPSPTNASSFLQTRHSHPPQYRAAYPPGHPPGHPPGPSPSASFQQNNVRPPLVPDGSYNSGATIPRVASEGNTPLIAQFNSRTIPERAMVDPSRTQTPPHASTTPAAPSSPAIGYSVYTHKDRKFVHQEQTALLSKRIQEYNNSMSKQVDPAMDLTPIVLGPGVGYPESPIVSSSGSDPASVPGVNQQVNAVGRPVSNEFVEMEQNSGTTVGRETPGLPSTSASPTIDKAPLQDASSNRSAAEKPGPVVNDQSSGTLPSPSSSNKENFRSIEKSNPGTSAISADRSVDQPNGVRDSQSSNIGPINKPIEKPAALPSAERESSQGVKHVAAPSNHVAGVPSVSDNSNVRNNFIRSETAPHTTNNNTNGSGTSAQSPLSNHSSDTSPSKRQGSPEPEAQMESPETKRPRYMGLLGISLDPVEFKLASVNGMIDNMSLDSPASRNRNEHHPIS